ncbi:MAG: hypothetical protein JWR52_2511 [Marmoricola sp.]|nr:hypothetical protein [Marmoricola sp.]
MRDTPEPPPITRHAEAPVNSCSETQRSIDAILVRLRAKRLKEQTGPNA